VAAQRGVYIVCEIGLHWQVYIYLPSRPFVGRRLSECHSALSQQQLVIVRDTPC